MMRSILAVLVVLGCTTSAQADWSAIQTVDSPGRVGLNSSLALDSSGYPRIAYSDHTSGNIKHAAWNGLSWDITTLVDSTGCTGWWPSLALDSGNYPHISYWDNRPGSLDERIMYACKQDSSGWHIQELPDPTPRGCAPSSLALDSNDHPHITSMFWTPYYQNLRYGAWDGSSWRFETVDGGSHHVGGSNSLALDSSGYAHIAYRCHNGAVYSLKYARWDGGAWDITTVDSGAGERFGWGTSLALDGGDYPHITYADHGNGSLKYASWDPTLNGGSWDTTTVDSVGGAWADSSLALDSSGFAHISYYNETNQEVRYAVGSGSDWDIQTVAASGPYVYQNSSLALDSSGVAHISYFDGRNQGLMYASNGNADDSPELGTWLLLSCTGAFGAAVRRMRRK